MNGKRLVFVAVAVALGIGAALAEDDPDAKPMAAAPPDANSAAPAAAPSVQPPPTALPFPPRLANRPRGKPPETLAAVAARDRTADATASPLSFVAEEKWGLAGYNNDEPFYTVLVTNHEPRALRCTVLLEGTSIEDGAKVSVSDRQTATVQPGAQTPLGNWQGMDRASGAHYSVKCRPL